MAQDNIVEEVRTSPSSRTVGFRISKAEYEAVTLVAEVRELTVAEYLRDRVNVPAIVEDADRIRELARAG